MQELKAMDSHDELVNIGSDTNINNGVFVFSQNKDIWFNLPSNLIDCFFCTYFTAVQWSKNLFQVHVCI